MKAIVMNGAGDIDMLEYVERPDPSQPAQPRQPQRRWAAGGQRRRGPSVAALLTAMSRRPKRLTV